MQDLHVTEILPQMITLSEAYIQIWELSTEQPPSTDDYHQPMETESVKQAA